MEKDIRHIEIVRSEAKGLSYMSQESCVAILGVLSKYFAQVSITLVNNSSDLEGLVNRHPDLVFLGVESVPSNPAVGHSDTGKIWLSDELDYFQIPYIGSTRSAIETARHKYLAKQRVLDVGLKTAAFCVIHQGQTLVASDVNLDFPLFVKPTSRGGGLGIDSASVVNNFKQLRAKAGSIITELHSDALIEEYLPGREFSVAILRDEYSDRFMAMPIELVAPIDHNGSRLLSNKIKSSNTELALEVSDERLRSEVAELGLAVFHTLGARDYGRIDIRLDESGVPHFLEANLIPSLISCYGSFPKACVLNAGLDYEPMILQLVNLALSRENDGFGDDLGIEPLGSMTPAEVLLD